MDRGESAGELRRTRHGSGAAARRLGLEPAAAVPSVFFQARLAVISLEIMGNEPCSSVSHRMTSHSEESLVTRTLTIGKRKCDLVSLFLPASGGVNTRRIIMCRTQKTCFRRHQGRQTSRTSALLASRTDGQAPTPRTPDPSRL